MRVLKWLKNIASNDVEWGGWGEGYRNIYFCS